MGGYIAEYLKEGGSKFPSPVGPRENTIYASFTLLALFELRQEQSRKNENYAEEPVKRIRDRYLRTLTLVIKRIMDKASTLERHRREGLTEEQAEREAKSGWCQYEYLPLGDFSFLEKRYGTVPGTPVLCPTSPSFSPAGSQESGTSKVFGLRGEGGSQFTLPADELVAPRPPNSCVPRPPNSGVPHSARGRQEERLAGRGRSESNTSPTGGSSVRGKLGRAFILDQEHSGGSPQA